MAASFCSAPTPGWATAHRPQKTNERRSHGQEVREHLRARIAQRGPADDAELDRLIELWKREEALLREARRIGLDARDPIVDRRLTQLMRFTLESEISAPTPTDEALETFLEQNAERYRIPPTVSFEHRFYGTDTQSAEDALRDKPLGQPPAGGLPFLHGTDFEALPEAQVISRFGDSFASELLRSTEGDWRGPSRSAFGVHLWRTVRRTEARLPPLATIRARVLQDWQEAEDDRLVELRIDRLVEEYTSAADEPSP